MAEDTIIDYVTCAYCDKEWTRSDLGGICSICEPKVSVDIAVVDMNTAISTLENMDREVVGRQWRVLLALQNRLAELIGLVKPKTGE